jgi:hypothetical protein
MMLIVILAFVMVMRGGRTKYEKQDYFKQPAGRRSPQERWQQPRDDSSGSYSSRWDRQNNEQSQSTPERIQRNVAIVVISLAIVAIAISIYTESLIGLFIIFALPVIIRFLRIRGGEGDRRRTSTDRGDSSSSI